MRTANFVFDMLNRYELICKYHVETESLDNLLLNQASDGSTLSVFDLHNKIKGLIEDINPNKALSFDHIHRYGYIQGALCAMDILAPGAENRLHTLLSDSQGMIPI